MHKWTISDALLEDYSDRGYSIEFAGELEKYPKPNILFSQLSELAPMSEILGSALWE